MVQKKSGFTLVELLIVMAVISILSVGGLSSYQASQMNARNAKRKGNLETIRQSLEIYRSKYGQYPDELANCDSSVGLFGSTCQNGGGIIAAPGNNWNYNGGSDPEWVNHGLFASLVTEAMLEKSILLDPINNGTYYYYYEPTCNNTETLGCNAGADCATGCCSYRLGANHLETTAGPSVSRYEVCDPRYPNVIGG